MSPQRPRMMIFIPLDRDTATAVRSIGRTDERLIGYAATGQLINAHGYRTDEREDADYAAQLYASIAGIARSADDRRLVVAADVPIAGVSDHADDADYGSVGVRGLDWADVTAVFVDDNDAAEAVGLARKSIQAQPDAGLAGWVELPAVTALTDSHELLWHTPDEAW
ncbi:DUF6912 family protein [Microlunatus soli]|uniref:Uncharacterized protein n=1 Tax=Microlunatus soli TaxID=630515 RepID=A0A1H1MW87_9ACTN|nr:hypothetical protein [Microlunatus soli]SDR90940.1 hypothetical protein SAMN04489812_0282 [Microlunatus soli]